MWKFKSSRIINNDHYYDQIKDNPTRLIDYVFIDVYSGKFRTDFLDKLPFLVKDRHLFIEVIKENPSISFDIPVGEHYINLFFEYPFAHIIIDEVDDDPEYIIDYYLNGKNRFNNTLELYNQIINKINEIYPNLIKK